MLATGRFARPKLENGMSEKPQGNESNPLHSVADELSATLGGRTVELSEERVRQVTAGQVLMKSSAAQRVQASAAQMEESAAALVSAGSLDARESAIGVVTAREATVQDSAVSLVAAGRVRAEGVRTVVLLGGRIEGEVTTVLTPLTALLAGAGFALTLLGVTQLLGKNRKR
jgi:hypothetical protein